MPAPLALLLCAVAILGVARALVNPVAQSPDEDAHFGYAQVVAEDLRLPDADPGRTFSKAGACRELSNANQVAGQPFAKRDWNEVGEARWQRAMTADT